MDLPLHMLPLCCHSLTTGYFHHIVVLSGLVKLPKPKLGKSARVLYFTSHTDIKQCLEVAVLEQAIITMLHVRWTHRLDQYGGLSEIACR
jgi:hypothetical protein